MNSRKVFIPEMVFENMPPDYIEKKSFDIIEELVGEHNVTAADWSIVRRMIHACGDPEIVNTVRISAGDSIMEIGKRALLNKIPVICDVQMVTVGISKKVKELSDVHCFITDQDVAQSAKDTGETRARRAMYKAVAKYPEGIYMIGNAPTALLTLLELIKKGDAMPTLIVGIPVGFVMAAESKAFLAQTSGLNYITNLGYKGGTPMTVAALNAIAI